MDEKSGYLKRNPVWCKTCKHSHGDNAFENKPEKAYCIVYNRNRGIMKPDEVLFFGKECKYYEEE